ncbi:hypothetical protein ABDD95_13380 [Mucilaginibacter sp. PAMB04274]|uniref:hypothetical protein n=1 Tax=Mucilaginibacter sp. PAMB04274 TaxID=3138568 RepID=UPI0031F675A8
MRKYIILAVMTLSCLTNSFAQSQQETLRLFLPSEYNWKLGSDQESGKNRMMELIPKNETLNNWSIIVTTVSMKGVKNMKLDPIMNAIFEKTKSRTPQSKLRIIERKDSGTNPWIIFKIEPGLNVKNPESQLYYIFQGNQNLYNNFVAVKKDMLGPLLVEKWTKAFKASKLVYK